MGGGNLLKTVLCRNLTGPAILAGLAFRPNRVTVVVVALGMWKPAFGAGFQAPWDGQQISGKDSAIGPTEGHFQSESRNSAHFGANVVVAIVRTN
jgi:hypothetical protein